MAGVAGPMMQRERETARRFVGGLLVGLLLGALALALVVSVLGVVVRGVASVAVLNAFLAVICLGFGTADILNRTPHVWRQVPQRFVRTLPSGQLGVVWGFDLGLLVTTQKAASLLWVLLVALLVLEPSLAPVALVATAFAFWLGTVIVAVTWSRAGSHLAAKSGGISLRIVRGFSGLLLVILGIAQLVRAS